jgi:tyrosine-protein phosphatase YwqE
VNLSALGGMEGWFRRRLTRKLVKKGLIHAVASDAHTENDVKFSKNGLRWLETTLGPDAAQQLLSDHPRRIIAGELPEL